MAARIEVVKIVISAKFSVPELDSPSEPKTANNPAMTDMVFESGPLMKDLSAENDPKSAPTIAVISATVIPNPTKADNGPENNNAPYESE